MAIDLGPDGLTLGSTTVNDWADVGGGKVLQVLQTRDNTVTTIGNTTASLSGGLTITPSSTSSKILLMATINLGEEASSPNWVGYFRRGSTDLGYFTDSNRLGGLVMSQTYNNGLANEHSENATFSFLDSPSTTSAITYYVRLSVTDGTLRINRVQSSSDSSWATRGYTTITAMEIAQ
jgi:hypothetical protein